MVSPRRPGHLFRLLKVGFGPGQGDSIHFQGYVSGNLRNLILCSRNYYIKTELLFITDRNLRRVIITRLNIAKIH